MPNPKSLEEKILKGSIILLAASFLSSVLAYLIRILYSHSLSIEDYGLFYAVLSLPIVFTTYLDLGFGFSSVYFLPKFLKKNDYVKAWNVFIYGQAISLTMSVILASILIISAGYLSKHYFKVAGSENLIYILSIFLIAFSLINGMIQIYSGMQKEKYYSSITLLRWLFTLVLSVIFSLAGFANVIFFALAWSIGHLITAIIYLILLFYKHQFITSNKITWDKKVFKGMFSLAIPAIAETFISSIFLMTVTFFLTFFKGVAEVGIYNIIYPLASIPIALLTPLNTLLLPLVSHLCEGEKAKLKYLTEKILEIIPFISVYFSLFIILFPSSSVGLIFGQKWLGKVEVSLSILCLGTTLLLMSGILGAIALGIGKVKERLKIATVIAIIGIPINALSIWLYGILGAVIVISVTALIINLLFLSLIKKDLTIEIPYLFYLKLLSFCIIIFLVTRVTQIYPNNLFEFLGFGLVYSLIYGTFGILLRIYDKKWLVMLMPAKHT